jgi:pyruvate/oxaloacetate carboxyltransferase
MTDRDWKEIENELNGLVPGLPPGERPSLMNHGIRQAVQADEAAVLAHIADALTRENSSE